MKALKYITLFICLFMMNLNAHASDNNKKILVVYYTWSEGKNTETLANYIQEKTGADLYQIDVVEPYPSDYNKCVDQAKKEINAGVKPQR